jgi:hypothetical protein
MKGTIDAGGFALGNLAEPGGSSDAATKQYIDRAAGSVLWYGLTRSGSPLVIDTSIIPTWRRVDVILSMYGLQAFVSIPRVAEHRVFRVTILGDGLSGQVNFSYTYMGEVSTAAVGETSVTVLPAHFGYFTTASPTTSWSTRDINGSYGCSSAIVS